MLVSAPGGMNVEVAAGYAMVTGDTITGPMGQHRYGVPLTAAKTLGTITAPSGATRRDSIVCQVYDEGDAPGAGLNIGRIEYRVNPAESTTPEALPSGAELLAYCDVTVGAGAITAGMLTDMRKAARPNRAVLDDVQAFTATGTINPAGGRIVTFAGAAAQTITLPKAIAGRSLEVWNIDSADGVTVARAGTDTITENLTAAATSFGLPAGARASFTCVADGVWIAHYLTRLAKKGSFTPSAGTGNKAVTGLGFRPKLVRFFREQASTTGSAIAMAGRMDAAGNQSISLVFIDGSGRVTLTAADGCIGTPNSSVATTFHNKASFVSVDADGFTVNFGTHGTAQEYVFEAEA